VVVPAAGEVAPEVGVADEDGEAVEVAPRAGEPFGSPGIE